MEESEYVGDAYFPEVAAGPFAYAPPAVIGIACGDTFVKVLVIEVYGGVNIGAPRVVNIESPMCLGAVKCAEPAVVAVKAVLNVDEVVGNGTVRIVRAWRACICRALRLENRRYPLRRRTIFAFR
jgi:hypothetical protein